MKIDESIEQTAVRELFEETGLTNVFMQQFRVYSEVNRDPRERVVTVAFVALVRQRDFKKVCGGDDANLAVWFDVETLPPLAFDHSRIIAEAREYLSEIIRIKPVAFSLLDDVFTVSELQKVYEVINNTRYDRRNFQRKLMQTDIVEDRGVAQTKTASRPPKVYSISGRIRRLLATSASRQSQMSGATPEITASISVQFSMSSDLPENSPFGSETDSDSPTEPDSTRDLFNF